ncbi:MAG: nucleotidyltransferase family protein [Deltaproteobacteria bacterium]|nr:nucleotidyltransferase family protein [Deltaproteobacteria bacterium]
MGIDAVIAAGDGKAARKIFKRNKSLLDVAGKPIIRHIAEVLVACSDIDRIIVVGPKERFEEVLGDLDVDIIEQKRSLAENGWEGFLQTIPEYRQTRELTFDIIEQYRGKYALFLSGDIPLLSVQEIQEFISRCDMTSYDYVAGITSEEILKLFGPRKGRPGIKMATFHTWDGNFRQNNLHMARPFELIEGIDLVLKAYEYRYQKEFFNIVKTLIEIIKLGPGNIGKTLAIYLLLQISAGLDALGLGHLAHIISFPVTLERIERMLTSVLKARCTIVRTTVGGAALDVDNEKDFMILSVMYRDWLNQISYNK